MKRLAYLPLVFATLCGTLQCQITNSTMFPGLWCEAERVAFIEQIGLNHLATILQFGSAAEQSSYASIYQYHGENVASIEDHGENNTVTIRQLGLYQEAEVILEGDGNDESIEQRGLGNLFLLESTLDGAVGVFSQEGRGNVLTIKKHTAGSVPVEIHQIGNELRLIIE